MPRDCADRHVSGSHGSRAQDVELELASEDEAGSSGDSSLRGH